MKKSIAGINGFGRFGLHLLRYWSEQIDSARFSINYINDCRLSLADIEAILATDRYFSNHNYTFEENAILIHLKNGSTHRVEYTNDSDSDIAWVDNVELFFECSGQHTANDDARLFIGKRTRHVLVSATIGKPDFIAIYGYNHRELPRDRHLLSYGSCTVNAYVPIAAMINDEFGVIDSDVNVIHNVPEYQLQNFDTLKRKACTLQAAAPMLLPFIHNDNFLVNYTLVPYSNVSIMDFRFRLQNHKDRDIKQALLQGISGGVLNDLYGVVQNDNGPEEHKFTTASAVLVESSIQLVGDNLYFQAYFDNENSVNRYFDIGNYLANG